ncbi:alpha-galactosidase [Entomortierella parvispora]|uniref:alpha-galactosidase n=1 Tax=Entomortierella parvispora TaxID=205924 RepID=A0A9P3HAK3_9FUNG|nr:alpha-galactosidase [Entomortierella parvispora]
MHHSQKPAASASRLSSCEIFQALRDHPLDVQISYKIQSQEEIDKGFYPAIAPEDDPSVTHARILNVLPTESRVVDHILFPSSAIPGSVPSPPRQLMLSSRMEKLSDQSCVRILELTLASFPHSSNGEAESMTSLIEMQFLKASLPLSFKSKALFANGYQSWSTSYLGSDKTSTFEPPNWLYGELTQLHMASDKHIYDYPGVPGKVHSNLVTILRDQIMDVKELDSQQREETDSCRPEELVLCGSLSEDEGYTYFLMDTNQGIMTLLQDCLGKQLGGERDRLTFKTFIAWSDQDTVIWDEYASQWKAQFRDRRAIQDSLNNQISGWTSWYLHYEDISEKILLENLHQFTASASLTSGDERKKWPAKVFQIDDGYTVVGDWLECKRDRFPNGMKAMATAIRERGLTPGLWLAPFLASRRSKIVKEHPEWFLKKAGLEGQQSQSGSKGSIKSVSGRLRLDCFATTEWSDSTDLMFAHPAFHAGTYAIDLELPAVRNHLQEVFRTVVHDWGFKLLKLDFLFAAALVPRNGKTRGQLMFESMQMIRSWVGPETLLLGCGVPLGSSFMVTDFCRIGCDVGAEWDSLQWCFHDREYISCFNSLTSTLARWAMSGRFFGNDPDVYFIRDWSMSLSTRERRTLMILNHLLGHLVFSSDPFDVERFSGEQKKMLDDLFPWYSTPGLEKRSGRNEERQENFGPLPPPHEIVRVLQPSATIKDLYLIQIQVPASSLSLAENEIDRSERDRTLIVATNLTSKKQTVHLSLLDRILAKQEDDVLEASRSSSSLAKPRSRQASVYFQAETGQFGSSAAAYSIRPHDTVVFLRVVDTYGRLCGLTPTHQPLPLYKQHHYHQDLLRHLHLPTTASSPEGTNAGPQAGGDVVMIATHGGHALPLTEIDTFSKPDISNKDPHQLTIRFRPSRFTTKQVQIWFALRTPSATEASSSPVTSNSTGNLIRNRKSIANGKSEDQSTLWTVNGSPLQIHSHINIGPGITLASTTLFI